MKGSIAVLNKYWKPYKSREDAYDHHSSDYCRSDAFVKRVREEIFYGLNDTILVFFELLLFDASFHQELASEYLRMLMPIIYLAASTTK